MSSWLPALGRWVADYYLLATLLLVVVWLAMRALGQPIRRVAVAKATMIALVVLAVVCFLPAWPRIPLLSAPPSAQVAPPFSPAVPERGGVSERSAGEREGALTVRPSDDLAPVASETFIEERPWAEEAGAGLVPAAAPRVVEVPEPRPERWWSFAALGFLGGAAAVGLWLVCGGACTLVLRRRSAAAPEWLEAELRRVVRGDARPPRLLLNPNIGSAVAVGILRPTVILPSRLVDEGTEEGLRAALAHEWAHIRNGDLRLLALSRLVLLATFAHPVYWWLRRRIREDQEAVADSAVARGVNRRSYARAILNWARVGLQWPPAGAAAALGIWERRSHLARRITMLLDERVQVETSCPRRWRLGFLGLALSLALSLSVLTLRPVPSAAAAETPASAENASEPAEQTGSASPDTAGADTPKNLPRYRFQPDERYVYEIKIETDLPDEKQTMTGHSYYKVKSVDEAAGRITLSNRGSLSTHKEPKSSGTGSILFPPWPPLRPFFSSGAHYGASREVIIEPTGNVLKSGEDSQLPYLLGNLWELMIDPMPPEGKRTWHSSNEILVVKKRNRQSRVPFRPLPLFLTETEVNRPARQTVTYTLGETTGKTAVIQKKYKLVTDEKIGGRPRVEHVGQGEIAFDLRAGVPQSLAMEYTLTVRRENVDIRIPTTVSARLLTKAEAEEMARQQAERAEAAKAAAAEAAKPRSISETALNAAIADLKSDNHFKVRSAANRLALAIPDDQRRKEVVEALEPLLKSDQSFVPGAAAKALGVWGTKESVPALLEMLEQGGVFQKSAAMEALAVLKDERGIEAIVEWMQSARNPSGAVKALQAAGPMVEKPMVELLDHHDWLVRMAACQVLADVGTEASIKPLEELEARSQGGVAQEAKKALEAIKARGQ